jgi:hypothetical protein
MHDPMTVAFEIRRPWPQRSPGRKVSEKRWKIGKSPFWNLAGVEYYWPGLITVWHVDPSGFDSNEDCPYSGHWQWHVHHWRLQIHPWQNFRRWALTRCEWCGGRSRKGDYVNISQQWDRERGPWWKGERGLFHSDCASISSAHRQCACHLHVGGSWEHELSGRPYGECATCGNYRGWQPRDDRDSPRDVANRLMQTIPVGGRDDEIMRTVKRMWKEHRNREVLE